MGTSKRSLQRSVMSVFSLRNCLRAGDKIRRYRARYRATARQKPADWPSKAPEPAHLPDKLRRGAADTSAVWRTLSGLRSTLILRHITALAIMLLACCMAEHLRTGPDPWRRSELQRAPARRRGRGVHARAYRSCVRSAFPPKAAFRIPPPRRAPPPTAPVCARPCENARPDGLRARLPRRSLSAAGRPPCWPRKNRPGGCPVLLSYPLHPPGKPAQPRTAHFPAPCKHPLSLYFHGTRDDFGTPEEMRTRSAHPRARATYPDRRRRARSRQREKRTSRRMRYGPAYLPVDLALMLSRNSGPVPPQAIARAEPAAANNRFTWHLPSRKCRLARIHPAPVRRTVPCQRTVARREQFDQYLAGPHAVRHVCECRLRLPGASADSEGPFPHSPRSSCGNRLRSQAHFVTKKDLPLLRFHPGADSSPP